MYDRWSASRCQLSTAKNDESLWVIQHAVYEGIEIAVQTYGAFTASNYMSRNAFRAMVLLCNIFMSPVLLASRNYTAAVAMDIVFDVAYTAVGLTSFLQYFYEKSDYAHREDLRMTEVIEASDWQMVLTVASMVYPYLVLLDTVSAGWKRMVFMRLQKFEIQHQKEEYDKAFFGFHAMDEETLKHATDEKTGERPKHATEKHPGLKVVHLSKTESVQGVNTHLEEHDKMYLTESLAYTCGSWCTATCCCSKLRMCRKDCCLDCCMHCFADDGVVDFYRAVVQMEEKVIRAAIASGSLLSRSTGGSSGSSTKTSTNTSSSNMLKHLWQESVSPPASLSSNNPSVPAGGWLSLRKRKQVIHKEKNIDILHLAHNMTREQVTQHIHILPNVTLQPQAKHLWSVVWPWLWVVTSWSYGIFLFTMFVSQPECALLLRTCEYTNCVPNTIDVVPNVDLLALGQTSSSWVGTLRSRWVQTNTLLVDAPLPSRPATPRNATSSGSGVAATANITLEFNRDSQGGLSGIMQLVSNTDCGAVSEPGANTVTCSLHFRLQCSSSIPRLNFKEKLYSDDEYRYITENVYSFVFDDASRDNELTSCFDNPRHWWRKCRMVGGKGFPAVGDLEKGWIMEVRRPENIKESMSGTEAVGVDVAFEQSLDRLDEMHWGGGGVYEQKSLQLFLTVDS